MASMTDNRSPFKTAAIVLAAGKGTRYKHEGKTLANKLLVPCTGLNGKRRSVLEHTLSSFAGKVDQLIVVTRPEYPDVLSLAANYHATVISLPSTGMGDSISAAVPAVADAAVVMVALGDMPYIKDSTLEAILAHASEEAIVTPLYEGQRGHPVCFGRRYLPMLAELHGDVGARHLLQDFDVTDVVVDDPGVLHDIDVPEK